MPHTYESVQKRIDHSNRMFMGSIGAIMLVIFFGLLGIAILQGAKTQKLNDQLTRDVILNRQRGNAVLCIISTPVTIRTVDATNKCLEMYGLDGEKLRGEK